MKFNLKHEFRTPLNHVIGYSELLLEEARDEANHEWIQPLTHIHRAGIDLLALIEEQFAPPRAGTNETPPFQTLSPALEPRVQEILTHCAGLASIASHGAEPNRSNDLEKIADAAQRLKALASSLNSTPPLRLHPSRADGTRSFRKRSVGSSTEQGLGPDGSLPPTGVLLVVDDDDGNREMLSRRLARLGHQVLGASNGIEALKQLEASSVDLVLLDLQMPEMDGYQTLLSIRGNKRLQHLPVVILSASSDIERVARCIEMGAEDYLPKPFNPVLLQARIRTCLEKKHLRDRETTHLRQIREEQQRSDELLHMILPRGVASELKATNRVQPACVEGVAVLFTDIVGFTHWSSLQTAATVHRELASLVEVFEDLALRHGLGKIKTIGDSFMATAGLLDPKPDAALAAIRCGLAMIAEAQQMAPRWKLRAGIHVGTVMAGVVGRLKHQYDIWGDTVNTAARMEQAAPAGTVCVEASVWRTLQADCLGTSLGTVAIKGKGELELYSIHGLRVSSPTRPE